MTPKDLDKLIVNSKNFLCYIADKETFDLIYVNEPIKNFLGMHYDNSFIGKKCYKIFQNLDKPCPHCVNSTLKPGEQVVRKMFVHLSQAAYTVIDSLINIDGKDQRMTIAFDNTIEHTKSEEMSQKLTLESTLLECVNTLRKENSLETAINSLLGIVGSYYNADRAYLSEVKENFIQQSFEWSASPKFETLSKIPTIDIKDLESTIEILKRDGYISVTDIEEEQASYPDLYKVLKRFNVTSILLIPLYIKEEISGIMGVDNPKVMINDHTLLHSVSIFVNDDIKKNLFQKELERLSYTDKLTGVYNRNKYAVRLEEIDASNISSMGIIHININSLKQVNELYGEAYGDYLIKEVAHILLNYVKNDIYRLSGDEFVALCSNISQEDFENLTESLRKKDSERKEVSFAVGGIWQDKHIDIRLGVSQASDIMLADKQYHYKGKSGKEIHSRRNPLSILLEEIQNGNFSIYLQPKVELKSEKIIGAEALIRKRDNKGKIISPDKFIPIYEHEGTIRHVDFYVFEQVCILLKKLIDENKAIKIAVNFSRVTFMAHDIIDEMTRICKNHSIPHKYIKIEITESIDKLDFEFFEKKLHSINEAGFDVSLDDFGAKHSNLLMLSMIDFTEVKIDKSLIDHMTTRNKNRTVVRNIIKTITELGSSICLAEGIETKEQKIALQELGCHYGQGYYFYKPMPIDDFCAIYDNFETQHEFQSILKKLTTELYFSGHSKEIFALIDATPLCMSLLNHKNINILCNQQTVKTFGLATKEEYALNFEKLSPLKQPDGRLSSEAGPKYIEQAREEGYVKFNWLHCDINGNEIPAEVLFQRLEIKDNEDRPYIAAYVKDLRPQLAGTEDVDWGDGYFFDHVSDKTFFNSIADMTQGWFFGLDLRTSNIKFFGKGKDILNLPSTKQLFPDSFDIKQLIHQDDLDIFYEKYNNIIKGIEKTWDFRFNLPTGESRYYRTIYKIIYNKEHDPIFCIGRTFDVHEEKMLELLSQTDLLTNCFNKITTENLIKRTIEIQPNNSHAMFIFDIDNFKAINDNLGHHAGDRVLTEIAKNLQDHFRDQDIIGRIGGDEFVVFLKNINNTNILITKAEMIAAAFKRTFIGEDNSHKVSGSIGISLYPEDGKTYDDLYKTADKALYQSKLRGKDCYTFFSNISLNNVASNMKILENANKIVNSYLDFDLVTSTFETMYHANDFSEAMTNIFKLISERFSVDRVQVLETENNGISYNVIHEYNAYGINSAKKVLDGISPKILGDLLQELDEKEVIYYKDIDVAHNEVLHKIMQDQNIKTTLLLETKGKNYSKIIFALDDCKHHRLWTEKQINSMRHIIRLLSIFLVFSKKNLLEI